MWHKRHRPRDSDAPPAKRLRDGIVDLYASGEVSGEKAQDLLEDAGAYAHQLGRPEFQDVRASTGAGSSKNTDRDLRTKLLRGSKWPPVYIQSLNFWAVKTKTMIKKKVAFLLPHEVIGALAEAGSEEVLTQYAALDASNLSRYESIRAKLGAPFVSVSLWGDGVPYSWDRRRSVDIWTMSFPGLESKQFRDIRISITALPHDFVVRETQDDVMSVLAWSFKALAKGEFPSCRADGEPWLSTDGWRKRRSGQPLLRAAVLEVKGDWKQLVSCFGVPHWMGRSDSPICWRCKATKSSLWEERGPESAWLQGANRLSHFQMLERIAEAGGGFSPVWSLPFMNSKALRIDWLHVCDQGISPVFLGGLFHMLLADKDLGSNAEQRCAFLWETIQEFYHREKVVDKLHSLVVTMIKPKKGSIELSGSGAQIRALIPFGVQIVDAWDQTKLDAEHLGARAAMRALASCYAFLSANKPAQGSLLDHGLTLQKILQGLHSISKKRWQLRPKLHMFLELAAEGANPSASWNYREESFGGSVSRQAHVKGGVTNPLGMSRAALTKFCVKESLAQDQVTDLAHMQ